MVDFLLNNCAHCSGDAHLVVSDCEKQTGYVKCLVCGVRTSVGYWEKVVEVWNKRAGMVECEKCRYHDKLSCPAYDKPMRRTSLRLTGCTAGEPLEE